MSIVGENNVGKSSLLSGIQLALPETDFSKPDIDHFPSRDTDNGPIEVELIFEDIHPDVREKQGIRTHIHDDEYRIKKQWTEPRKNPTYFAYAPEYEYPEWVESKRSKNTYIEEGGDEAESVIEAYEEEYGSIDSFTNDVKKELIQIGVEHGVSYIEETSPTWSENPGGIQPNPDSALPNAVLIPAIKKPSEEVDTSRKSSSVGRLVNELFEEHLVDHPVVEEFFNSSERVKEIIEGEEKEDVVKNLESDINEKVQRMIDIDTSLIFEPPDVTSGLASQTDLEIVDGEVRTKTEHQGHGAQRALILSLLELLAENRVDAEAEDDFRRPLLLMIEEPEIYMHPQMLRRMRDVLLDIARSDTAQVICTTHSPVFIDLADRHDGLVILEKKDGSVTKYQKTDDIFPGDTLDEAKQRLRMILDFDPTVNESFFSSHICLVVGDTELAIIEAIARRLAEDDLIDIREYRDRRRFVTVVSCKGKWNIRSFQRVLNGFNIDYSVVHDKDPGKRTESANSDIEDLHPNPGNILINNPDLEAELFDDTWDDDKPWRATKEIDEVDELPAEAIEFFEFVLDTSVSDLAS